MKTLKRKQQKREKGVQFLTSEEPESALALPLLRFFFFLDFLPQVCGSANAGDIRGPCNELIFSSEEVVLIA
jgi:hypothetical protein